MLPAIAQTAAQAYVASKAVQAAQPGAAAPAEPRRESTFGKGLAYVGLAVVGFFGGRIIWNQVQRDAEKNKEKEDEKQVEQGAKVVIQTAAAKPNSIAGLAVRVANALKANPNNSDADCKIVWWKPKCFTDDANVISVFNALQYLEDLNALSQAYSALTKGRNLKSDLNFMIDYPGDYASYNKVIDRISYLNGRRKPVANK